MKATCRGRLAVLVASCALLLPAASARAADQPSRAPKSPKAASTAKPASKGGARAARSMDMSARRQIVGGPTSDDLSLGVESPELRALRLAEEELFPPAAPAAGSAWPSDLPLILPPDSAPRVRASGVPPSESTLPPPPGDGLSNVGWLAKLELPDLPVRWDQRVVRYLEYFRDDPRGHATFAILFRHSGRFRDFFRRALRQKSLPEDLVWVAMIESGFDPTARSISGAAGVWQFMPETARIYGLAVDHWLDQRYDVEVEAAAAIDLLGDLRRRFGSWELALAAYNMGHAGLTSVIRRYNTNDFWSLTRTEGALPWETALYVPKILAASVIAHNLSTFGFGDLVVDPPVETDQVEIGPATPLSLVAQAAGCDTKEIEGLNPELRAGRTPPGNGDTRYAVKVPRGKGAALEQALRRLRKETTPLDRYVVRFGETLEEIAAARRTTTQKLVDMNAIAPGEAIRGGTVLLVPPLSAAAQGASSRLEESKPSVVVPSDEFVYPDRRRVFYRVLTGDTLKEIAGAMHVSVDELCRWNEIDPSARLQEGMTLQAFVAKDADLSHIVLLGESDVKMLPVGSDEFFAALEQTQGFRRVTVAAKAGDTLESIGRRFDVSPRTMERINRRNRGDALRPGETVIVYSPGHTAGVGKTNSVTASNTSSNGPLPNGPLPSPPIPDLLP